MSWSYSNSGAKEQVASSFAAFLDERREAAKKEGNKSAAAIMDYIGSFIQQGFGGVKAAQPVTISTHGHLNADGTGSAAISFAVSAVPQVVEAEPAEADDDAKPKKGKK